MRVTNRASTPQSMRNQGRRGAVGQMDPQGVFSCAEKHHFEPFLEEWVSIRVLSPDSLRALSTPSIHPWLPATPFPREGLPRLDWMLAQLYVCERRAQTGRLLQAALSMVSGLHRHMARPIWPLRTGRYQLRDFTAPPLPTRSLLGSGQLPGYTVTRMSLPVTHPLMSRV